MVSIGKGPFTGGRPDFEDKGKKGLENNDINLPSSKLLEQNSLLKKLAPSNKSSAILDKLQILINKVLSFFVVRHPSQFENRIVRMLQAAKNEGEDLAFGEYALHYRDFLNNDKEVSDSFKKALNLLQKENDELLKLQQNINLTSSNPNDVKHTKAVLALETYQAKKRQELENMRDGESRLYTLSDRTDDVLDGNLFGVLTKNNGAFTFRVIGRGSVIGEIEQTMPLAGKQKIHREIAYNAVPKEVALKEAWLNALYSPQGVSKAVLNEQLKACDDFKTKAISLDDLTTKTDKTAKLFWNVAHAFPSSVEPSKQIQSEKRIKIRSHLLNLFEIFRNHRLDLQANTTEFNDINKLFTAVSSEVLHAYEKNVISKEDLSDIRKELAIIDKTLKTAQSLALSPLQSTVPTKKHLFFGLKLADFNAHVPAIHNEGTEIQSVQATTAHNYEAPLVRELNNPINITLQAYTKLTSKDDILNTFRAVAADDKEFFQFFRQVPINLFDEKRVTQPGSYVSESVREKANAAWWSFTANEKTEVMQAVNAFTERFVNNSANMPLNQYNLDTLLKMTYLLSVWERDSLGPLNYHDDVSSAINSIYPHTTINSGRSIYDLNASSFARFPTLIDPSSMALAATLRESKIFRYYYLDKDVATSHGSRVDHPHSHKQLKLLALGKLEAIASPQTVQSKLKLIKNPFLLALYRQMDTRIHWDPKEGNKNKVEAKIGWMSPEAVQTDPDGLLAYFLSELDEVNEKRKDKDQDFNLAPIPLHYSDDEKRQLLRLLKTEHPQVEVLNILLNYPNLLSDPDARNFCDAIFFHPNLLNFFTSSGAEDFFNKLPQRVEEKLNTHLEHCDKLLKYGTPKEIQKEFEVILYLSEFNEKLRELYKNPEWKFNNIDLISPPKLAEIRFPLSEQNSKERLRKLFELSQKITSLQPCSGYIARIILRQELQGDSINKAKLADVLHLFEVAFDGRTAAHLIDPHYETILKSAWVACIKQVQIAGRYEEVFSQEAVTPFLNTLISSRQLPPTSSPWVYKGNFIFANDVYQVHMDTFAITSVVSDVKIQQLPQYIFQSPDFKRHFGVLPPAAFNVTISQENGKTYYAFKDLAGISCRVEIEGEKWTLYKKSTKWLQAVPASVFSPQKQIEKSQEADEHRNESQPQPGVIRSVFNLLSSAFKMLFLSFDTTVPSVFKDGFYIDPTDSKKGYRLNKQGEVELSFIFADSEEGVELLEVLDHRAGASKEPYQMNVEGDFNASGLQFLQGFENPANIVMWSQKNKLQKVELVRYGLSFTLNSQNQLVVDDPKFKGYHVVANPRLSDKKYLTSALLLEHTDPTKPKKLLLPSSDALVYKSIELKPSSWGLANLILSVQKIVEFIRLLMGKPPVKPLTEMRLAVSDSLDKISYTSLDLRPYTEEICPKEDSKVESLIELAKHYMKESDFVRANQFVRQLSLKAIDNKTILRLIDFVKDPVSSPQEAAIKFKMLVELKQKIKIDRQQKKNIQILNTLLLQHGKAVLTGGRTLPQELLLTEGNRIELGKIAKKNDPEFYEKHLKVYFAPEGQIFEMGQESALPDNLDAFVKGWKQTRTTRNRDVAIEQQEKAILPNKPLTDAQLSYTFKRLAPGKEVYRLFTPQEIDIFFRKEEISLPPLDLANPSRSLSPCEQMGLDDLRQDVNLYKTAVGNEVWPILTANEIDLKKFVNEKIVPLRDKQDQNLKTIKAEIESLVFEAPNLEEQFAFFAGRKNAATFDELRVAFGFDKLQELQALGKLPKDIDLQMLKTKLTSYFEALVTKNAADSALQIIDSIQANQDPYQSKDLYKALYQILTVQCTYDSAHDPRFLVFEAQQFLNFKALDAGLNQLQLVEALLVNPYAIVQAPTGAGKTTVLSVLQSLCKPNGANLVVQKVLPPLFQQTFEQYRAILGSLFGMFVYPLRFNMKMRLTKTEFVIEKTSDGKEKEVPRQTSIFKIMYDEMLATIQKRGCVLTDYKSFPMLEEKFWRLSQELVEMQAQGVEPASIIVEHHTYLKKILTLLSNRSVDNMDEFDQPNRPVKKIQLDLGVGAQSIAPFMIDTALELYMLLMQDSQLGLKENIQQDITAGMRKASLERAVKAMAVKFAQELKNPALEPKFIDYFMGKNEEILPSLEKIAPQLVDKIAFCQREFTQFLQLSLGYKEGSNYARSDDGLRTVPCHDGQKTEAKFGTLEEQVNATIQDYFQKGITHVDLRSWLDDLKQKHDNSVDPVFKSLMVGQLQAVLPTLNMESVDIVLANPEDITKFVALINKSQDKILPFLRLRLSQLKSSGRVISMGPQDIVNMSKAVSGTSATVGAPDSLHPQFQVDKKMNGMIRANMALRLVKRAATQDVLKYDPRNPLQMLDNQPFQAAIDGSGAFNSVGTKETAQILKNKNSSLKQVGYHVEGDEIAFVGETTGSLSETGFVFNQAHTRGTDVPLAPDAQALLTLSEQDGLRDICQKEGRLRKPTQKYHLAMTSFQPEIKTISHEVVNATCKDAQIDAKDIFKTQTQIMGALIRKEARSQLLAQDTLEGFLKKFSSNSMRDLFIAQAEPSYSVDGEYGKKNCRLRKADLSPAEALEQYRNEMMQKAKALGLVESQSALADLQYSPELLARMPEKVASIAKTSDEELEMELEVEQEEELENEEQLELALETENEKIGLKELGYYPVRISDTITHSVHEKIHPAYDPVLEVADSFLPLSRQGKKMLRQRVAFDDAMFRVGLVAFTFDKTYVSSQYINNRWTKSRDEYAFPQVVLCDYIADTDYLFSHSKIFYDMRTDTIVNAGWRSKRDITEAIKSPAFIKMKVQIKFLDGQCFGYSPEELESLKEWLIKNNPTAMKDHFLNQILRNRYKDKVDYEGSPLSKLFENLKA